MITVSVSDCPKDSGFTKRKVTDIKKTNIKGYEKGQNGSN